MDNLEAYTAAKEEVLSTFEIEEILKFHSFDSFWDQIDVNNGYEEEWEGWKRDGVVFTYLQIFNEIKGINQFESVKSNLLELACLLNLNMNAHDDDLQSTWENFQRKWDIVKVEIETLIKDSN